MPGGAPPPMQLAPLQFSSSQKPGIGDQMQTLGKNLKAAGNSPLFNQSQPLSPADGTVGMPGSPYAGPVAPGGPDAPVGAPGSPMAGPMAPVGPMPGQGMPGGADVARMASPPQLLDWLRRQLQTGQPFIPQGYPGSYALQGAGMLPGSQMGGG